MDTGKRLIIFSAFLPSLPLKEAAIVYGSETGIEMTVNPGPPGEWMQGLKDGEPADLICCGAEFLLDIAEGEGLIVSGARRSMGRRRSGLLVPPGNPGSIAGIADLAQPEVRVGIAVEGCTLGLWDEISSRAGLTERIRANIATREKGCSALLGTVSRGEVEAGFGWINMDQVPDMSVDIVRLPKELEIIRSTGVAVTSTASDPGLAGDFVKWLTEDSNARGIYKKWGWEIERG